MKGRLAKPVYLVALPLCLALLAGLAAPAHTHLGLSAARADLPTFAAGHEEPEHTAHVEGSIQIASPECDACLQPQRQRAVAALRPSTLEVEPAAQRRVLSEQRLAAALDRRLAIPRGPPSA